MEEGGQHEHKEYGCSKKREKNMLYNSFVLLPSNNTLK